LSIKKSVEPQLLAKHDTLRLKEFEKPLAEQFNLSAEELSQMYSSGNGPMFYDRISWALSYLKMAGLVLKPKWGTYQISKLGKTKLSATPNKINHYIDEQLVKRTPNTKENKQEVGSQTPEENLYSAFESIRASIYTDIIDTILSKSPKEFENLVVKLLQAMGYGGEIEGIVTPYSNDGGIDGIIKEDVLGLGRIHIQAKRYARDNRISREEIQKFVGALAGVQSSKGVFITTSSYKHTAIEYANGLSNATVILIDGLQLAKYIYEYGLGMQVEQTIEIKKMDGDFWDLMNDE
jgi:restriction system protein